LRIQLHLELEVLLLLLQERDMSSCLTIVGLVFIYGCNEYREK
jgi:hypothetical protein